MRLSILDSQVYGQSWVKDPLASLLSEEEKFKAWIHILVQLAKAQSEQGIIPEKVGASIEKALETHKIQWEDLRKSYLNNGHSFQGLFDQLSESLGECGEYLGYGCTVQDITDTWLSSILVRSWNIYFQQLKGIEKLLMRLVDEHKSTAMIGRTHGQWGAPITFGYKAAVWLQEVRRHMDRFKETRTRLGFIQLSGSVGVMSGYGPKAFDLQKSFSQKMHLRVPVLPWTNSRDTLVEFATLLTSTTSCLSKMAHEVYNLQRKEIAELHEGHNKDSVGSVTMPQKKNPENSEQIGSLARIIRHQGAILQESLVHEHERDGRSWKVEWAVWPEILCMTSACLEMSLNLLENLQVSKEKMLENLESTEGSVLSEALMMALAPRWGLGAARQWVREQIYFAKSENGSLQQIIETNKDLKAFMNQAEREQFLDYKNQLGQSVELCNRALSVSENAESRDEEFLQEIMETK